MQENCGMMHSVGWGFDGHRHTDGVVLRHAPAGVAEVIFQLRAHVYTVRKTLLGTPCYSILYYYSASQRYPSSAISKEATSMVARAVYLPWAQPPDLLHVVLSHASHMIPAMHATCRVRQCNSSVDLDQFRIAVIFRINA